MASATSMENSGSINSEALRNISYFCLVLLPDGVLVKVTAWVDCATLDTVTFEALSSMSLIEWLCI